MCDQLMSYYDNAKTIFVFFLTDIALNIKDQEKPC